MSDDETLNRFNMDADVSQIDVCICFAYELAAPHLVT